MENNEKCSESKCCKYPIWKCIGFGVLGVIGAVAFILVIGFAIMWLWNSLMPSIFNLGVITFWQAVGLAVLGRLLFGSHCGWHRKMKGKWGNSHCHCGSKCGCKCGCNCCCSKDENGNKSECCSDKKLE